MIFEFILKFFLIIFSGMLLLTTKKIKCDTNCFKNTILLGFASLISSVLINNNETSYLIFFAILIGAFILNDFRNNYEKNLPIEALILVVIAFLIGNDKYLLPFIVIIMTIITSIFIEFFAKIINDENLSVFIINIDENASVVIDVKKILIDLGIKYKHLKIDKTKEGYRLELFINTSKNKTKDFIERAMQLKNVNEIETL